MVSLRGNSCAGQPSRLSWMIDDRYDNNLEDLGGMSRAQLLVLINPDDDDLPEGVEDGVERRRKLEIRHFLGIFRGLNKTLDRLSNEESAVIDALVGMDMFSTVFKEFLPATIVPSTESTPERGLPPQPPRDQARRNREQQDENDAKDLFRLAGPDENDSAPNPPSVHRIN